MAVGRGDPREMQQGLDQLAELLQFQDRFVEDPRATLERYGVRGVPDDAIDAIAKLTPDELRVFARVQHRLAGIPDDGGNCLLF